jgi:hypothetical protein
MEARHYFVLLLIVLLIGFGIVLGSSSRLDVMAHWAERRCDLDVMIFAFMYKPDDIQGSAFQYAGENLNFCINQMTTDYLNSVFAKMFTVLQQQMGAADIMTNVMNSLRSSLANIFKPFSSMMGRFWNKFKQIGALSSRIFQQLYMAMKKAASITIASLYLAISMQVSFMNGIDLVVNIIMIVLYIMLALAIIFFLPLLPVMVFVLMASGGIESAFPGRTGGMGALFCFAPNTRVLTSYGEYNIQDLVIGQILADGSTVEAVIELPGSSEPLYVIDGIYVSGGHRVWSYFKNEFVSVKDHPLAEKSTVAVNTVWTLITSSREIPVRGLTRPVRFADWEELPDSPVYSRGWDLIVRKIINPRGPMGPMGTYPVPKCAPCLDSDIRVKKLQGGYVPLKTVQRGDWVLSNTGWTKVVGICYREVDGGIGSRGARITDGLWFLDEGQWKHPTGRMDSNRWIGMQLVTESGSFYIRRSIMDCDELVRDFTEVGSQNLQKSYDMEDLIMEVAEKKIGLDKKSK